MVPLMGRQKSVRDGIVFYCGLNERWSVED